MMSKKPPLQRMSRLNPPRALSYTEAANKDIDKIGRDQYENLIEPGVREVAALVDVTHSPCVVRVTTCGGWFRFKRFKVRVAFYVNGHEELVVTAVLRRDDDTYRIIHQRWNRR